MTQSVVALVLAAIAVGGCGGDKSSSASSSGEVVVRREDGSRLTFSGPLRAWCAPWAEDYPGEALHVGTFDSDNPRSNYWLLFVSEADLGTSTRLPFPNHPFDIEEGELPRGAVLFVNDKPLGNELSTDQIGAAGAARVEVAACEEGEEVSVEVDATLGSEYEGGPSATARGRVSVTIGEPVRVNLD